MKSKDYIHRVGRTARAGRMGQAITLVTQYEIETYQRMEATIGQKFEEYKPINTSIVFFYHFFHIGLTKKIPF